MCKETIRFIVTVVQKASYTTDQRLLTVKILVSVTVP